MFLKFICGPVWVRLNAGAVLLLPLGLKFVTLYHINMAQASVFSNSSHSLQSATGSRRKILPETIAACAWILPEPFGDIVGWISRGGKFLCPVVMSSSPGFIVECNLILSVIEINQCSEEGTPEFCWLFNSTPRLWFIPLCPVATG